VSQFDNAAAQMPQPFADAAASAAAIAEATGVEKHDVALVLGSGWGEAADLIGETTHTLPADTLPGFHAPAVAGHPGTIRSILTHGGKRALVIAARTHYYEGRGVRAVAHGMRTAAAAGCETVVLTNGCGGLRRGLPRPDQRPPEPDRHLLARGRHVRGHDRPLLVTAT
jgi:purine-nucleoside phosphorylase